VHLGHGTTAYHLAAPHEHLHAHCVSCDRVIDLPGSLLDAVARQVADEHGFVLDPSHVALSGTCAACIAHLASDCGRGTSPTPGS
jgi:Fur family ferric uptake transcriptional regulator